MRVSKKPLLELEPYCEDYEWEDFLFSLGVLIRDRFETGYVKCSAENMGWRKLKAYKVFECDINESPINIARNFLFSFMPNCDWSTTVYSLNSGRGLFFTVTHHDNPVGGDRYFLTPISQRTYERLS